jgi:DNA transformation protein
LFNQSSGFILPPVADDSFKEFVLDQLGALPEVRARAMFGAHGLFCDGKFFAILDEGQLFFKTDAASAKDYTARGMEPFSYEQDGRVITFQYHEVPPEILEQPPELVVWARRAIQVAAAKPKKPTRKSKPNPDTGRRP